MLRLYGKGEKKMWRKKDRQCTYKVTLRAVRVTGVALEKH
jgi:hypothetical protein